jgi:hypothetical protein
MYFTIKLFHVYFKRRFILSGFLLPFLLYAFMACPSNTGKVSFIFVRNIKLL